MLPRALLATFHYLALALGFASVVVRGLRLGELRRGAGGDDRVVTSLLRADSVWALAAALWISTGLLRVFGGLERASAFYLRNGFFYVKMALFLSVFALEIYPIVTFTRWRSARRKGAAPWSTAPLDRLIRINGLETALVVVIVLMATMMARGAWLF